MFYQNWKLSLVAIIMIPLASFFANFLGKRITKVTTQAMDQSWSSKYILNRNF